MSAFGVSAIPHSQRGNRLDHAELRVFSAITSERPRPGVTWCSPSSSTLMARHAPHTVADMTYEPTDPYRIAVAA
jgi:hypothetical protein